MDLTNRLYHVANQGGRIAIAITLFAPLLVGQPADAEAQGAGATPFPANWQYEATLYGLMVGIDGDAGIRSVDAEVDVGFDDIFENLDFGAMGFIAGRDDTWSFVLDAAYLKLSAENSNARSILNTTLTTSLGVELEQTIVEGFVGRRILGNPETVVSSLI